ncbi:Nucleotide-binding alpha-beta plait [Penicillium maclennaniae]|uniref:Nucleotide-binding alpha-beta plait n=1 Tax=Penicillium maclennaniae TaxID=1343394 RepID=UPI0025403BEC|nr:Nucleotide-binding alpha-beta plait [Penicillium maclennaniae]KAJ5662400.1 Nucleotide-binding alpha-beta plait [Penicillium maclennaniae]
MSSYPEYPDSDRVKRERSRSPRRRSSRSPRRSRRSYTPRSRSRSRDDYRPRDRRSRSPLSASGATGPSGSPYGGRSGYAPRFEDRTVAKENMMQSVRDSSQQDRRVYVGNLSYDVKWHHLKDFMRQAGEVLFADVLLLPNGMSKGCGIVEYATREQAQQAVNTLSNQNLMGRLVYVREDRESEPRFIGGPPRGDFGGRGGFGGPGFGGHPGGGGGAGGGGRQLYVSNGSGIVAFESPDDARNAIAQFNGYEWQGRPLEVREDRFAGGGPGFGGRGGGFGGRGGFGGGPGFGGRGGFAGRGGFGGGFRGGYGGPPAFGGGGFDAGGAPPAPVASSPPNPFTDFATSGGEKSAVIYVRNSLMSSQLPWSTCNEDLIDLFSTIGKVERAEIQYEPNGRSRGTGVVEFDTPDTAETAIAKFTGYQYGGRPLGITFVKYLNAGPGPEDMSMMEPTEPTGLTQDQIM